ncbi:type II toxin-antitoxin system RelE family toxin [Halobacteriovorax marinus]|uniref:type II toxin-antitoxin system RelE family toxin n=1 Tax=Halobacteriovorax marinus TaxID=97084 RepID=UPI003A8E5078
MANYRIEITASAEKSLKKVPKKDIQKIVDAIQILAISPFPEGCRKLKGEEDVYRVRQGNYRIIYEVIEKKLVILVLKVGHRKDIYKK